MIRYTTANIRYKLISAIDFDSINDVWVTIQSDSSNKKTWKLSKNDVELDKEENTIVLKLAQGDTANFKEGMVDTQFRIITKDGDVFASKIKKIEISRVLEEGIMNVINTTSDPVDPPSGDTTDPTDPPSGTDPSDPTP